MWRRVSECKFSWERSVGPLWAGSHPVFALKKERGNRVSPQFTFFRPMGPFASHTHRVGTAARPPSSLHFSLTIWTTTWPGSSGADSLFGPCSCRPFEDVPGEVLFFFSFFFVASFQPDGTKKRKMASLCHILPSRNSRRCWGGGKCSPRPPSPPICQVYTALLWIYSLACFNLCLAITRCLRLWQRPRTVRSKPRNVMLTLH